MLVAIVATGPIRLSPLGKINRVIRQMRKVHRNDVGK